MTSDDVKIREKLDREIASVVKQARIDRKFLPERDVTYAEFLSNKMLIIFVIRKGIPYSFFHLIQLYTPFSETDWANILDLSTKSLHRYKQSAKKFRPIQSEKIIEMAEVTDMGVDVFGSMEKFKLWLDTPNYALGSLKPVELITDSYGKEMVVGELTRFNHGILA